MPSAFPARYAAHGMRRQSSSRHDSYRCGGDFALRFAAALRFLKSDLGGQTWVSGLFRGWPHDPHRPATLTFGASLVVPTGVLRSIRTAQTWPSGLL